MSYLKKLILILSLSAVIISCGTESESEKLQGTWENTGLDDHYITALDYSDSYLFVAGKEKLFRKDFSTETAEWLELDIKINSENSEFLLVPNLPVGNAHRDLPVPKNQIIHQTL